MASPSAVKPLSPAALWAHPPRGRALQADGCEIYSPLVISDAGLRNTLRMLKAPHRAPPAVTALGQSISYLSLFVGLRGQTDPLPWPWGGGLFSLTRKLSSWNVCQPYFYGFLGKFCRVSRSASPVMSAVNGESGAGSAQELGLRKSAYFYCQGTDTALHTID